MAQILVGEMEIHSVGNIADPFKKAPKLYLVWETKFLTAAPLSLLLSLALSISLSLSLSLSLSVCLLHSARGGEEQHFQLNTDIMLLASLILHDASIAEITAQLLSLSYLYLISSDYGSIIRIFVQIILEMRAGYVVLMVTFQSLFHIHPIFWQKKQ